MLSRARMRGSQADQSDTAISLPSAGSKALEDRGVVEERRAIESCDEVEPSLRKGPYSGDVAVLAISANQRLCQGDAQAQTGLDHGVEGAAEVADDVAVAWRGVRMNPRG